MVDGKTAELNAGAALSELVSSFQAMGVSSKIKTNEEKRMHLPTPLQFYQLGLVLAENNNTLIAEKYQEWMKQLPFQYLKRVVFCDLNTAFISIVSNGRESIDSGFALNSLCGLYSNSSLACQAGYSMELCTSLAAYYDELQTKKQQPEDDGVSLNILRVLSALLLHGLLNARETGDDTNTSTDEESHLERVMDATKTLTTNEKSTCLGDLQEWQQLQGLQTLEASVQSRFESTAQRDYLTRMLQTCPRKSDLYQPSASPTRTYDNITTRLIKKSDSKPLSATERRIQSVREVLPDLGEGYIETALSCYHGDVSQTVAALIEGASDPTTLHPALQVMDKTLPARRKQTPETSKYQLDDDEARNITKTRFKEMEQEQESEAHALSAIITDEYNDDYDDQYDEMDGGTGGADVGMYDFDFDTIKTYNRVAREAEQEGAFWEENKNLNREVGSKKKTGEGEFRGPDKGKGGRIIGPDGKYVPFQKGGKKGRQQQGNNKPVQDGETEKKNTKIQQRRKNNNKAKIANHHRKERAQKKTGGM